VLKTRVKHKPLFYPVGFRGIFLSYHMTQDTFFLGKEFSPFFNTPTFALSSVENIKMFEGFGNLLV